LAKNGLGGNLLRGLEKSETYLIEAIWRVALSLLVEHMR
jgi:hypothetical protein